MIVKVCGLREADNIRAVEATGADWLGFIFYPRSPRCVTTRPEYLPQNGMRVGVFVSPGFTDVMARVADYGLRAVQLHGETAPEMCRKLRERGLIVIRALPADDALNTAAQTYLDCTDYFLFDTPSPVYGGSGRNYDLSILHTYKGHIPFLLSGGIGPQSIEKLHHFSHPAWVGIDLNSRFETTPGVKDAALLHSFISNFRNHEPHQTTLQP